MALKSKKRKKSSGKVKGVKNSKLLKSKKSFSAVSSKVKPIEHKKLDDPLEVQMPPKWLGKEASSNIIKLRKLQYGMWGWVVALALILLITITSLDLLSDFEVIGKISHTQHSAMETGETIAIFVIFLELATGFKSAKNKLLYLKQNWLAILIILPIGSFIRVLRSFEGLLILEELASLRAFQVAGKFGELRTLLPVLELPYELRLLSLEPLLLRAGALLRSSTSVLFGLGRVFEDIIRVIFPFLK